MERGDFKRGREQGLLMSQVIPISMRSVIVVNFRDVEKSGSVVYVDHLLALILETGVGILLFLEGL